jgi:hypothetical protein
MLKKNFHFKIMRIQLPDCTCVDGPNEYNQLFLHVPAFAEKYKEIEESIKKEPWNSSFDYDTGILRTKLTDTTQFFNTSKEYITERPSKFQGCTIKCIIEIGSGPYFFKGLYGITTSVYQLMITRGPECLFNDVDGMREPPQTDGACSDQPR